MIETRDSFCPKKVESLVVRRQIILCPIGNTQIGAKWTTVSRRIQVQQAKKFRIDRQYLPWHEMENGHTY